MKINTAQAAAICLRWKFNYKQRWEFIKDNKKVRKHMKTRVRPRKRSRNKEKKKKENTLSIKKTNKTLSTKKATMKKRKTFCFSYFLVFFYKFHLKCDLRRALVRHLSPCKEVMTDRPKNQPTDRQTEQPTKKTDMMRVQGETTHQKKDCLN